jgi:hypothetical protein
MIYGINRGLKPVPTVNKMNAKGKLVGDCLMNNLYKAPHSEELMDAAMLAISETGDEVLLDHDLYTSTAEGYANAGILELHKVLSSDDPILVSEILLNNFK